MRLGNERQGVARDKAQGVTMGVVSDEASGEMQGEVEGTTEGIAFIENIMEHIAKELGKDPVEVKLKNLAKNEERIADIVSYWKTKSDYSNRVVAVQDFNKVAQVCAYALGMALELVSIKPSNVLTSPNNMVTGGSIASESCAYLNVMYSGITDALKNYYIHGVTVAEVEVDVLTGEHQILHVDILEDAGESLSPEIDIGQVEGAFVMGLGYWLKEFMVYDNDTGKALTNRTWNYKPPGAKDIPIDFRIQLRKNAPNPGGVLHSKDPPATPEKVFLASLTNYKQFEL
ncbi:xanthine dehydrogenase-like [Schistocerca piceifrons]|uniref:xanthine dehydrogenase-like n=1 Tax=Schistocerca piceifrons TaxID=274613 RepID=UPI001F5F6535|nr:xanthine dehydrogenase-like [Schistocerca piceifrons]